MLDKLTTRQKIGLGVGALLLFKGSQDDADAALLPSGLEPVPSDAFAHTEQPSARTDFYAGTAPTRSATHLSGAVDWRPGHDLITVTAVPHYAVYGCCKAWATAYPTPDGGRTSRGVQYHPDGKAGRKCGCTKPGRDVGRSWWVPLYRADRKRRNVPDVEFAPGDTDWSGGTAGEQIQVRGFVHDGVAWIVSTKTRNFRALTDANRDVVYLVSTIGRAAYNARLGRLLEGHEWRPLYKGKPVEISPNPWAVHPWSKWIRQGYPGGRQPPLQADQAYRIDGYEVDFVGPVYADALMRKPLVALPFRTGKKRKTVTKRKS